MDGLRAVKPMSEWQLSDNAAYLHYCPNETIDGIAIDETPNFASNVVVTADLSSTILSAPLDVSRYGVIYAGAQKNIGPAGLTVSSSVKICWVKLMFHARQSSTIPC